MTLSISCLQVSSTNYTAETSSLLSLPITLMTWPDIRLPTEWSLTANLKVNAKSSWLEPSMWHHCVLEVIRKWLLKQRKRKCRNQLNLKQQSEKNTDWVSPRQMIELDVLLVSCCTQGLIPPHAIWMLHVLFAPSVLHETGTYNRKHWNGATKYAKTGVYLS